MLEKIKKKIDQELVRLIGSTNTAHQLRAISPVLFTHIKEFVLRKGKRGATHPFCVRVPCVFLSESPRAFTQAPFP